MQNLYPGPRSAIKRCRAGEPISAPTRVFDALWASGQRDLHDRLVCEAAAEMAPRVDRIVLAQASLAHLAEPLTGQLGLPVYASPELLVHDVVTRVRPVSGPHPANGDTIFFAPPLVVTDKDVDRLVSVTRDAVKAVLGV